MTNDVTSKQCSNSVHWFQSWKFVCLASPFSLQISSQLVTTGAGGRGGSLRSEPTPQGYRACQGTWSVCRLLSDPQVLKAQGGPPLPPAPPKSSPKVHQKSDQKKGQIFDPKWSPKGTLKISKILPHLQNCTLKHLSRALLAAFISERVSKPSPKTSRTSKIIVLHK